MAFLLILVVVIVVGGLAVVLRGGGSWLGQTRRAADDLVESPTPTLDYLVAEGQDAAAISAALTVEGMATSADPREPDLLHVACPAGIDRDRARARAVIGGAVETQTGQPADVRFRDEA